MDDVVFLDSDDDQDTKVNVDSNKNVSDRNGSDDPVKDASNSKAVTGGGDDDIMVEYNHNDYADLVGPLKSATTNGVTPSIKPPTPQQPPAQRPNTVPTNPNKLPKRPGAMPPFALFSQEMRAKLQKEDPNIGFGDLGRKLGEMWHALTEEEKEEYRKKARQVADARMRSYNETMKAISPQKRQMIENQQRMQMNKIKKKRTSGYSIFCSEYRRKLAQEQPDLPFADISKTVADDWRLLPQDKKETYERRAQRFNMEEEKRWKQRMLAQQQTQMRMRQQMSGGRGGGGVARGGGSPGAGATVYRNILPKTSRGRGGGMVYNRRGQYNAGAGGQMNQSGLVIASVSSLSSPAASSQSNYSLPQGISISKADPDINLPKSISISRVEPEIQIVEESIQQQFNRQQHQQQRVIGSTVVTSTRGRGYSMRGRGGQVRPNIAPRGMGMMGARNGRMIAPMTSRGRPPIISGRGGVMMSSRGRGMALSSPVKRIIQGSMPTMSPVKRMAPVLSNPPPLKRPRMPMQQMSAQQSNYNIPGSVNPASLDSVGRLCRVCGVASPVIFRLSDRRDLISKINQVLNMDLDLDMDIQSGYPGVICRKCANMVETFHNFQLSVTEGQRTLSRQVEAAKKRKEAAAMEVEINDADDPDILISTNSPESIGVDPLESSVPGDQEEADLSSILPDTELEAITIKQERIGGTTTSSTTATATATTTATTAAAAAPMTSVFTDAVTEMTTIKVEPDIMSIKRESEDDEDSTSKISPVKKLENIEITPVESDIKETDDSKSSSSSLLKEMNFENIEITPIVSNDDTEKDEKTSESVNNSATESTKQDEDKESQEKPSDEDTDDISNSLDNARESSTHENANAVSAAESQLEPEKSKNPTENAVSDEQVDSPELGEASSKMMDGNEEFANLFSDYPDWQETSHQDNVDDLDWLPEDGGLEDLEDTPVMEVRTLGDRNGEEFGDPLFEMEDEDDRGKETENGDSDFGAFDPMSTVDMEDGPENVMEEDLGNNDNEDDHLGAEDSGTNDEQMLEDTPADFISDESGLSEARDESGVSEADRDQDNPVPDSVNEDSVEDRDGENTKEVIEDNLNEDCDIGQNEQGEPGDENLSNIDTEDQLQEDITEES